MANKIIVGHMIRSYLTRDNMTMKELGTMLGKTESTVSKWISGASTPMAKDLSKMTTIFKTDIQTLMFGAADNNINIIYNQLNTNNQKIVYDFASRKLDEQDNILKFPDRINEDDNNTVLNYGYVSAGTGEYMIDNQPEEITVHGGIPADYDFAVTINGDSMEPMFADGQVIFVRSTVEAISGQIVIAELNGDAYVKKLQADEDSCRLVSLNSKYKPIDIDEDDDFKIVGVVVL